MANFSIAGNHESACESPNRTIVVSEFASPYMQGAVVFVKFCCTWQWSAYGFALSAFA